MRESFGEVLAALRSQQPGDANASSRTGLLCRAIRYGGPASMTSNAANPLLRCDMSASNVLQDAPSLPISNIWPRTNN